MCQVLLEDLWNKIFRTEIGNQSGAGVRRQPAATIVASRSIANTEDRTTDQQSPARPWPNFKKISERKGGRHAKLWTVCEKMFLVAWRELVAQDTSTSSSHFQDR